MNVLVYFSFLQAGRQAARQTKEKGDSKFNTQKEGLKKGWII